MRAFDPFRIGLTVLVALAIWSLLLWQHFHGGLRARHLLADPETSEVFNGWGALFVPALT
jgi:hypothetical protein